MIFSKCKILLVLQLFLVFNCFAQLSDDFNRDSLEAGSLVWNQGLSSGMTGKFLIESNELRAIFDNGSGTREAYISTEINPDLQSFGLNWKGRIKLDFSNLSSSVVSKNLCRYYLMSDKTNLSDNPYGFFLEFKLVPTEDSLTCKLMFESGEGKTELQFENQEIKFKTQEYLDFEVTRNPDGDWKVWINEHHYGLVNFPEVVQANSTGFQIQYSSGSRENKFFMDDFFLDYHPFFDCLEIISPNELELFCISQLDSSSVFDLDNYQLNDSLNPVMVSFDNEVPNKIKLHFSSEFIPDLLNTIFIKGMKDENGYEISEERPQNLIFTYSQPDLSPPEIIVVTGIEKKEIFVTFNEVIAIDSTILKDAFQIVDIENQVIQFQMDSLNLKKLKLSFQHDFKVGNSYTLKVSQLADLEGNVQTGQEVNFVFSDNFPPGLEEMEVLSGKSLKLIFSEPLDEFQANQNTNYQELISELLPELALLNKENPKEIFLYFNQELPDNKTLELQAVNLEDIYGNQIEKAISINFIYDTKKPSINTTGSIFPINENQLELHFTEPLALGSANILNNYEIKGDIGFPSLAIRDSTDYSIVHLYFEEDLEQEKEYEITIRNVSDLAGNVISTKTRSFILDQKAPELVDLRVFSTHELKLFFSEPLLLDSAMLSANYWVNQGLGNPDSIFISPYNTKVAHLFFENTLPENDSLFLEISNLVDHYGNILSISDSVYFNTKLPSVAAITLLSDKTLEVKFSEKIDKTNLSAFISHGIEIPKNVTYQNTDSSTLIIELNGVLSEDSIYIISLENVSDFSGNIKPTIKESFIFNPIVEQVKVVESNVIHLYFEEELHPDFPLMNTDFSLNSLAIFPLSVILDQENHQMLTLIFKENFPADSTLKLLISPLMKKDEEIAPETSIDFVYDLQPPKIRKIEAINNELTITFSEPIEKIAATALNHYWINEGVGNPIDFDYQNDTMVSLFFENNFELKNQYFLTVENVRDLVGNTILDSTCNFKIYPNPRSNQLIITEIMADPSPTIGLPEAEFIEIWNVTVDTFNLAGMKLVDATGEIGFPNFLIYPNDYVILCTSGNFSQLMALGKTLSLTSFPSLNNSGETIRLISPNDEVINEVNYADDWYGNHDKTDGGWSLEIIDPFNYCSEKENWKASENSLGGTPGGINSLISSNPDTVAPKLIEWVILNDSTVNLVFSERMDTVSLLIPEHYEISGEMDIDIHLSNDVNSVELVFSDRLEKGKSYQITLAGLADKCGNYLLDFSFDVILPEQPAYNEIIVTEIFADPNPSVGLPEFEYLEIYNPTDKTFNLGDLMLEVGEDRLKFKSSLLGPFEYVVLTSTTGQKSFEKYGRTIGVTNWIALKNSGDQLILRNKKGELIFEITYQNDWYADIDKEDGGYSLEMKNVTQPCLADENWEASESIIGGTPGSENSLKNDQIRDDFPPELQKGYVIDELNIQLIFDGKLDSFSVVNAATKLAPEIDFKKVVFDYQNPKEIRLELESPLIEKIRYKVEIKDLQDCSGNTNVNWQSLILVLPEEADSSDILISEVLFNPPVGGIDFVEIYNNSDKHIDLKNWIIGNGKTEEIISEKPIIIAPNAFLTLTSDISQLKTQHPGGADSTFFETKLPSFNDEEGMVILRNGSEQIIDEFSYHEDFHNPSLDNNNGVSLERINYSQPTESTDNWTSAAETSGFATPGYRNSQHNDHQFSLSEDCFEVYPQVIIPDLDGIDDYAILNYGCLNSGSLATIIIYDAFGREIKSMLNNQLIPVDGQFIWDGTNNLGERVGMGNYIIQISLIGANGTPKEFRKNVAVGTRF